MKTNRQKIDHELDSKKAENDYFNWLCENVNRRNGLDDNLILLRQLHNIEFYGIVPNDENRAVDGKNLRKVFSTVKGYNDDLLDLIYRNPCSMFEMMIGMAHRMDYSLQDRRHQNNGIEKWFWILVDNLGLEPFYKNDKNGENKFESNKRIIEDFLERRYYENGRGGLFPLKNPKEDQTKVELWYQMEFYLQENYPIY